MPQGYVGKVFREAPKGSVGSEEQKQVEPGVSGESGEDDEDKEEEEEEEEAKVLEDVASFEELVVWGHEALPEDDDAFVKGVEEWVQFAEAVSWLSVVWEIMRLMVCRCMGMGGLR